MQVACAAGTCCHLIGWTAWHFGAGGKTIPKSTLSIDICHFLKKKRASHGLCYSAELTDTLSYLKALEHHLARTRHSPVLLAVHVVLNWATSTTLTIVKSFPLQVMNLVLI